MKPGLMMLLILGALPAAAAQHSPAPQQPDWKQIEAESLQHFQALLRIDTSHPPGNEGRVADYLRQVLERDGIAVKLYEAEKGRANLVARLPGSGRKRPLLLMAHTDVVRADPARWKVPPFSATRDGGYIYARGAVDDKDNLTAALMTLLLLKRAGIRPERDVILLAEAGEETNTLVGIEHMVNEHFADIDAEYCLAEGGITLRKQGRTQYAQVQMAEKRQNTVSLVATAHRGMARFHAWTTRWSASPGRSRRWARGSRR